MRFLVTTGAGEERDSFFTPKIIAALEQHGEILWNNSETRGMNKEQLIANIKDIDVLLTGWGTARIDADVLKAANQLKVHAHTGGSVASYISKEEYDAGVIVLSGNDLFAQSVAEGCLCYTLCALRRMWSYMSEVKNGGWRPTPDYTEGLIGKKIGIVGYGAIATYYVDLLKWFQPQILIASKYINEEEAQQVGGKKASMEAIFSTCDVISLHAALNEENMSMITRELLQKIRPGALLVNTARAGIIEEQALYDELKTGRFNAILDVFHTEPVAQNHLLRTLPNVTILPHIAGPTFDMREKVVLRLLEDILASNEGKPCRSYIPYDYAVRMTIG